MKDGLFRLALQTALGSSVGVVVLDSGKLCGGDSRMYYSGVYKDGQGQFSARISIATHTHIRGVQLPFGVDRLAIEMSGSSTNERALCYASAPASLAGTFQASLVRLSDLPISAFE